MTRGELLEFLIKEAREFLRDKNNIQRNSHLTGIKNPIPESIVNGVLVAFINHIGISQCIDLALDVKDLDK